MEKDHLKKRLLDKTRSDKRIIVHFFKETFGDSGTTADREL